MIHEADPQSRRVVITISHVVSVCPYVRAYAPGPVSNLAHQNKFQVKIVIVTSGTVGLAEWIIDSSLFSLGFFQPAGPLIRPAPPSVTSSLTSSTSVAGLTITPSAPPTATVQPTVVSSASSKPAKNSSTSPVKPTTQATTEPPTIPPPQQPTVLNQPYHSFPYPYPNTYIPYPPPPPAHMPYPSTPNSQPTYPYTPSTYSHHEFRPQYPFFPPQGHYYLAAPAIPYQPGGTPATGSTTEASQLALASVPQFYGGIPAQAYTATAAGRVVAPVLALGLFCLVSLS